MAISSLFSIFHIHLNEKQFGERNYLTAKSMLSWPFLPSKWTFHFSEEKLDCQGLFIYFYFKENHTSSSLVTLRIKLYYSDTARYSEEQFDTGSISSPDKPNQCLLNSCFHDDEKCSNRCNLLSFRPSFVDLSSAGVNTATLDMVVQWLRNLHRTALAQTQQLCITKGYRHIQILL